MKNKFLLSLCFFALTIVYSQNKNCSEQENEVQALINNKNYAVAYDKIVYLTKNCTFLSEDFFKKALPVFQNRVDSAGKNNNKTSVDEMMHFFDLYDKQHPKNTNNNQLNRAILLFETNAAANDELYSYLDKAFTTNRFSFTNPTILYQYFTLCVDKSKINELPFDKLLEKYSQINEVIDSNSIKYPEKELEYSNAKTAVKSLAYYNFTKEKIVAYAEKDFENNKDNAHWLNTIAAMLYEKNNNLPVFGKVAEQLYTIKKDTKSANYLATYKLRNSKIKEALALFEESISLNQNKIENAETYYSISKIINATDKIKANEYLNFAIQNNPSNGKYYIYQANNYANAVNSCATNSVEKIAINKLAENSVLKAAEIQPNLKATTDKLLEKYRKNTPTKQELDQIKKMGNKVKIGCWINQTVVF